MTGMLFIGGYTVELHEELFDEIREMERLACLWYIMDPCPARDGLNKELCAKIEALAARMHEKAIERKLVTKVYAYEVMTKSPELFCFVVYPNACSAICGYANLDPLIRHLEQKKLRTISGKRPPLTLITGGRT